MFIRRCEDDEEYLSFRPKRFESEAKPTTDIFMSEKTILFNVMPGNKLEDHKHPNCKINLRCVR